MNVCDYCGYFFKIDSLERIEFLIDLGIWNFMDEDMVFMDFMKFYLKEEFYKDCIDFY